jgi:hypothetical protein
MLRHYTDYFFVVNDYLKKMFNKQFFSTPRKEGRTLYRLSWLCQLFFQKKVNSLVFFI